MRLVDAAPDRTRPTGSPPTTRRVLTRFAAGNLIAATLLLAVSFWASHVAARSESLADARSTTDLLATLLIEPNLEDGLLTGDQQAIARLDTVCETRLRDASVVRIKIWDADERIVYSDESRLLWRTFPANEYEVETLSDGDMSAEFSALTNAENVFERTQGELLEVYRPVTTPGGQRLLLETYFAYDEVASRQMSIWLHFAPIAAGALLLLLLFQVPLARRMVTQLRAADVERLRLHAEAADATVMERRRIAGSLHDGVVQDLSAAPLIMSRAVDRLAERSVEDKVAVAADLQMAATAVRQSVASLRSLLIEIYPPHLADAGLPAALGDLVDRIQARGVATRLDLPDELDLRPETAALLFRVAQEALQNVVKHARARTAVITVTRAEGVLTLEIRDDGVGFEPGRNPGASGSGHFGMRVLRDLAEAADATLDVATAPGRGTALRLQVPD